MNNEILTLKEKSHRRGYSDLRLSFSEWFRKFLFELNGNISDYHYIMFFLGGK